MTKIQYISLILLLIFAVSIVNIFYKQWMYDVETTLPSVFGGSSALSVSTCPLYGFKCPTEEACDCQSLCKDGEYVPFRIMSDEPVYLMDRQLDPGTYCLPRGVGTCNQQTSYHVFSSTGWKCIPRNTALYDDERLVACYNDLAADHSRNFLWDYQTNQPARDILDPYQTLSDGKTLRYRCHCESLDVRGNRMVESLPFVCSVDYCVKDFIRALPTMGFTGTGCQCEMYQHQDPNDDKSPCVMERTRYENNTLTGRVDCMNQWSWIRSSIFCPRGDGVVSFETPIYRVSSIEEYMAYRLKDH